MGAGLALPYAAAPRLALSVLSQEQVGQGSGIHQRLGVSLLAVSASQAALSRGDFARFSRCAGNDRPSGRLRRRPLRRVREG